MVVTNFLLQDKYNKERIFEETFLIANTSIEIVLDISFLSLSDANIKFAKKE